MKIIVLWNSKAIATGASPDISVGVDSAVLRHGEPLFVQDGTSRSMVCPAVRIGRLGTHIPPRVAGSYADAITVFHLLMPARPALARDAFWGLSDRTFAPGATMPLAGGEVRVCACSYPPGTAGTEAPASCITFDTALAAPAIAAVSARCTFRTGDILVFADHGMDMGPAMPDRYVDADIDGFPSLHLKIK